MDRAKTLELTRLADGLQALLDEADGRGSVAPIAGMRELISTLRLHADGESKPLLQFLGVVGSRRGPAGIDKATQLELLREFRKLHDGGLTYEAAAERVGVDQTTISTWRASAIGIAEQVGADLDRHAADPESKKVTGRKRGK